jgi:beta-lactamase class A
MKPSVYLVTRIRQSSVCALIAILSFLSAPSTALSQQTRVSDNDPGLHHLAGEVSRLAEHALGTVGVAAYHLETGRWMTMNGEERFPMASTYKVPIATQILTMVDQGDLALTDMIEIEQEDVYLTSSAISDLLDDPGVQLSIHNLLELMLQISDNIATDILFEIAGGAEEITGRMVEVGADGIRVDRTTWALIANWLGRDDVTVANRIYPDEYRALLETELANGYAGSDNAAFNADPQDTATPLAMARLLRKIWDQEILSEESSSLLIDIMYRCQTGEARLKGALPPGTQVAHKTGTIGETTNDVGIIDLPDEAGHVITVVYIKESKLPDNPAMEPVIANIARAIHDYFTFNRG